jgi:glycosyltransferase involved in cell wall biosynthesis
MKNDFINKQFKNIILQQDLYRLSYALPSAAMHESKVNEPAQANELTDLGLTKPKPVLPEVLFVTSFPPRQCGIATYSQDLMKVLDSKFSESFGIKVCALESTFEKHKYTEAPEFILDVSVPSSYIQTAREINRNKLIKLVVVQHEFGLFPDHSQFITFLRELQKPVVMVFHTVLPHPNEIFKANVDEIVSLSESIVVMTQHSKKILIDEYAVEAKKISVIPHGTHLVPHLDKKTLKEKYDLIDKKVLSTFGLLSSGKSIETTLDAMPAIIKANTDVMFLIIGKTHPSVVKNEGEKYREMLQEKVVTLGLSEHVRFINAYLPLNELLEYLQLTDIYLFTSIDPNQAVSGTFSYAISCGCPIITTPIPQADEVLKKNLGLVVDFKDSNKLASAVNDLLNDEERRKNLSLNALHSMASTAWENSAISHALLFNDVSDENMTLHYDLPPINLDHIHKMTTDFGMIQFAKINQPDITSGYTIDDNARALIAVCKHYEMTHDIKDLKYLYIYFTYIRHCLQSEGYFLNYVDGDKRFTPQNLTANLADANGRAIWALGYLISISHLVPQDLRENAETTLTQVLSNLNTMFSTRAMGFAIKGLYYSNIHLKSGKHSALITALANRLVQMYKHEADTEWAWFESYLTYANSILPEAMLCAYMDSGDKVYKDIAKASFDFLLSKIFVEDRIRVISNKSWMRKGEQPSHYGEQPIDVAYTIVALGKFYDVFKEEGYLLKMETAFTWFLGNNHLRQTIYNPCTGGCYDGLEENHVNLNQGAESTVSYLIARLTMEKYISRIHKFVEVKTKDLVYN